MERLFTNQLARLYAIALCVLASVGLSGQNAANYVFSTNATGSLTDMSSGTTVLLAAGSDDAASPVFLMGFTFNMMGNQYTSFSVNSNGAMGLGTTAVTTTGTGTGTATSPKIAPFGGDQATVTAAGANSKVHAKVIGTAPNRILVVEWLNMKINYAGYSTATVGDGTYQALLYETTGAIRFIYGGMSVATVFGTAPQIGFSVGTAVGTNFDIASATNAAITTGTALTGNVYPLGAITNLNSAADGSRRVYDITPPATPPADPISLTFTAVGANTTTVNWVDNSTTEILFRVIRATDAAFTQNVVTTNVVSTTAAGTGTAYTSVQTGLALATTYYYKIQSANEGAAPGVGLSGTQATFGPRTFISVATGNWSAGATWDIGTAPTSFDNVTVSAGHTVTIDVSGLSITNATVNATGILVYGATPTSFTVLGNLDVAGTFNVNNGTAGRTLNVAGNITNTGTMNLSLTSTLLVLNGTTAQTVTSTGTITSNAIAGLTFNNTAAYPLVTWNVPTVSVSNATTSGTLTLTSGLVNLGANELILGYSATIAGTLAYNSTPKGGFITSAGGKFTRWLTTTTLPTTISNTTYTGLFPFVSAASGDVRLFYIARSAAIAAAGTLSFNYNDAQGVTSVTPITDGTVSIDKRTNANWTVTTGNGIDLTGPTFTVRIRTANFGDIVDVTKLSPVLASTALTGSYTVSSSTTGVSEINRSAITAAGLPNTYYIGSTSANTLQPFVISVATGNWTTPGTWNTGSVPTANDNVIIAAGNNVTLDGNGAAKTILIAGGGTLTASANTLAIGTSALCNRTFTVNGTVVLSGTATINHFGNVLFNGGSTFTQSGGNLNIDGNAAGIAANSVLTGTPLLRFTANAVANLSLTGGTITIVDPHAGAGTTDYVLSVAQGGAYNSASAAHTFKFGNGVSTDVGGNANGFYYYLYPSSFYYGLGNVIVDAVSTTIASNRVVKGTSSIPIAGNLTVTSGECWVNSTTFVAGNVVNNGILTTTSTLTLSGFLGTAGVAATAAQTISGSGIFRNLQTAPTASMSGLTVNNSNATGVTLSVPLSISGTFTHTLGLVNTSATSLLQIGTATAAASYGGFVGIANHIVGPLAYTFPSSRAIGTYAVFYTGKGGVYAPIAVDVSTSAAGPVIITAESFATNTGSAGTGVSNLSTRTWRAIATTGAANMLTANVRVSDPNVTATSKLLHSATIGGTYEGTPGGSTSSGAGGNVSTSVAIPAANYLGNFAYGNLVICPAPADEPSGIDATLTTSTSFTGTFTAASSNPTGYLVVRYATGGRAQQPQNGTLYAAAGALGTGTVVGNYTATPFTFTQTGLTASTTYDYYVYSFNNSGCAGPVYYAVEPTRNSVTTCATVIGAPGTPTGSAATTTSFTVSWTASSTATASYELDVATNTTFTSFVAGYNALPLPAGTLTQNITGLTIASTYYVRIRAVDSRCYSPVSTTVLSQSTLCDPSNVPYTQDFESAVPAALPNCTSIQNAGTGNNWTTNASTPTGFTGNILRYAYSSTSAANAWFYTNALNLTGGVSYSLTYKYAASSSSYPEKLKVAYGTASVATAMTNPLADYPALTTTTVSTGAVTFVPPTTGVYYIGFNAYSIANQFNIYVDDISVIATPVPTITNFTSSAACGSSTTLTINGTNLLGATVTVGGTAITPLTTNTATQIVATISAARSGTIVVTTASGAASSATPMAFMIAPMVTVTPSFARCANDPASTITATSSNAAYTYAWSSGGTGTMITPNSSATTTYTVTATDAATGCVATGSTTVTANPNPTPLTVTPATASVCTSTPTATLLAASGSGGGGTPTIGTGVVTNSAVTPYRGFWGGTKTQVLFTAAELTAAGLVGGSQITSIGYSITAFLSPYTFNGFTIAMKNTATSVLTSTLETGTTTVLAPAAYVLTGTAPFTTTHAITPFTWDGTSNLLVETCENNGDAGAPTSASNATLNCTTTSSNYTSYFSADDNATVCSSPGVATTSTSRPNITFGFTTTINYTWAATTGLFTDAAATTPYAGAAVASVFAKPTATTTYTATATGNNGCKTTNTATITVVTAPAAASAGPAQSSATGMFTLAGSDPTPAAGAWSVVTTGGVASVTNAASPTSAASVGVVGAATLRWTVTSGAVCPTTTSDVVLTNTAALSNVTGSCQLGITDIAGMPVTIGAANNNIWVPLYIGSNIVATIKANGQNLGLVSGGYFANGSGAVRTSNNQLYLDRNLSLSVATQPTSNVDVKMYITMAEWTALTTANPAITDANFQLTRVNNTATCSNAYPGQVGTPITGASIVDVNGFRAISFATDHFSEFFVHNLGATIPLEIIAFKATGRGTTNLIAFTTANEINVNGFNIERSATGTEGWSVIGSVKAKGASTYTFVDNQPTPTSYYRLRAIDTDGKETLSKIVSVTNGKGKLAILSLYPNPTKAITTVDFEVPTTGSAIATVKDITGRVVFSKNISTTEGVNQLTVDMSELANGLYILNISDKTSTVVKRIVKQ